MVALTGLGNLQSRDALAQSHRLMQISLERLSTGVRINRAEDDAAGVIVRDRFQAQMNGFDEAIRNIQTAQSMVQVAEQGINKITEGLQQMRALAVRAADDNLNDDDRERIQLQVKGLLREINERAEATSYNGHHLLDGSITDSHEERLGDIKIQTNSFLANGNKLVGDAAVVGSNATTPNGISQGSYEVKIVFSGEDGILPSMTTKTMLGGTINSPSSSPGNVTTVTQNITDRNAGAHTATFTFTQLGTSRNYTYDVQVPGGGVYGTSAQTFSGTLLFGDDGALLAADGDTVTPFERTVTLGDGTSGGQAWTIDFSGLDENQHLTTSIMAPSAITSVTPTGTGGPATGNVSLQGNLEQASGNGSTVTLTVPAGPTAWVDRLGAAQPGVQVQFTKASGGVGTNTDQWTWQVLGASVASFGTGGASISAGGSGTLDFTSPLAAQAGSITITDSAGVDQTLAIDFTSMTNVDDAVDTAAQVGTGTGTVDSVFTGNLDGGTALFGTFGQTLSWTDYSGASQSVGITFQKTFDSAGAGTDIWSWTLNPVDLAAFGTGGASVTGGSSTGTIDFSTLPAATGSFTLTDSAGQQQQVALDFTSLTNALAASTANEATQATATTQSIVSGNLEEAHGTGFSVPITASWTDSNGVSQTASIDFQKTVENGTGSGTDTWSWTVTGLTGAVVNGSNTGSYDFTSPTTGHSVNVTDSWGRTYEVNFDFSGLTNTNNAVNTAAALSQDGTTGSPTTSVNVAATLNPVSSPVSQTFDVRDRTNVNDILGNQITLTYLSGNDWQYTITANTTPSATNQFTGITGATSTGTLSFDGGGNLVSVNGITGATTASTDWTTSVGETQSISFDFGAVTLQTGSVQSTSNGSTGTPTTAYALNAGSNLNDSHVVSDSVTTSATPFVDRTGATHSVSTTFTKIAASASGDTWDYSITGLAGGAWTGANSGNTTGTLHFDPSGNLDAINGAPVSAFNIVVGDGSSAGQTIAIDFTAVDSLVGADSTPQTVTGTTPGNPTTSIVLSQNLVSGAAPTTVYLTVFDRTGTDTSTALASTNQPRITFSQVGNTNTYNYTITPPNGSGFNGFGTNLQGQLTFNDAGNLVDLDGTTTLNKNVKFQDGTPEGQTVNVDFAQINLARATNLAASSTDGGSGTSTGVMNAIVYYSDDSGQTDLNPVSTLLGVDLGARSYNAGGISFTVNTASSLNVGLVGYIKAYTYISATNEDRSLEFQVGPDEGNIQRIGISKMDVQTLFRRTENNQGDSSYTDIDLSNTLKAQDLIGQLDDALDFVSAENLKVGQFQNNMSRTLELARQNDTSITNAFSLLNDADMAKEATNQSKRSILVQSGTAMVAQSNTTSQFILQLLR